MNSLNKFLLTFFVFSIFTFVAIGQQSDFIKIETNKVLCIFSFLETTKGGMSVSSSYSELIHDTFNGDEVFEDLVARYSKIYMHDSFEREGVPDGRYGYKSVKDLLWIASSNAQSIEDYSERIIGYLPHNDHVELIAVMKAVEPYYDELVWNNTTSQVKRMERQLADYTEKISELYSKISVFYGTSWDRSVPFKIMLYPIPLAIGSTTAIPKGNTLICGFLTDDEDDYKGRLGVIIHEMCHILYDEQSIELQSQLSSYFLESTSDYNHLAYKYINEGLATVLGNGWSYKELHGELDTLEWYNDNYIDGFAHALLSETESYMDEGRTIDSSYIGNAISLFAITFPESTSKVETLFTNLNVYANMEGGSAQYMVDKLVKHFSIRGLNFSNPIDDPQAKETYFEAGKTKVFLLLSEHEKGIQLVLDNYKVNHSFNAKNSFLYSFTHDESKSKVVIINAHQESEIDIAFKMLSEQGTIVLDKEIFLQK